MTATPTFLTGNSEHQDDTDGAISHAAWVATLTEPAHAALAEAQRQQPSRPAAPLPGRDPENRSTLSEILDLIAEVRDLLVSQRVTRDYYTIEQVAQILGRANWTVRDWCRLGRLRAEKRSSGRGRSREWVVPHAELQRYEKEGLLPAAKHRP